MKNIPRDYRIVGCNDRPVIMLAAMRRTLLEIVQMSDRAPIRPTAYSPRSFQSLLGFLNSGMAGYLDALPRKLRESIEGQVKPGSGAAVVHQVIQRAQKISLDHVGFARLGIGTACLLTLADIEERASETEDEYFEALGIRDAAMDRDASEGDDEEELEDLPESSNRVYFDEIIGMVAQRLPMVEGLLQQASRRVLAELGIQSEQATVEVIGHDLTAPLILLCPDLRDELVSADQLSHQIPDASSDFAMDNLDWITDMAVDQLLAEEADLSESPAADGPEK